MTFALKVTPFSVKSLSEASVAIDRFKVSFLCLFLQIVTFTSVKIFSVLLVCVLPSVIKAHTVNPGVGAGGMVQVCLIWSK